MRSARTKSEQRKNSKAPSCRVIFVGLLGCAGVIATLSNIAAFHSFIFEERSVRDVPSNNAPSINAPSINVPYTNHQTHACPLDSFIDDECKTRSGGTTCIYPNVILKKMKTEYMMANELRAFRLLNDTRYFPELYHVDEQCQTILMENVRQKNKTANEMCSDYNYYEKFYKSAFAIFNEKNIIPKDLNTCCNTIVNGDNIRIIDFGQYKLDGKPEEVRETNKRLLEKLLEDLSTRIEVHKPKCKRAAM